MANHKHENRRFDEIRRERIRTPRSGGPKGEGQDVRSNPDVQATTGMWEVEQRREQLPRRTNAAERRMRESGLPLRHLPAQQGDGSL